jgi:hypothetical protein
MGGGEQLRTGSSELPQHTPAPEANEMGQPEVL